MSSRRRCVCTLGTTRLDHDLRRVAKGSSLVWFGLTLAGCLDTGQARVEVPLSVAGTALVGDVVTKGDVPLTVERADLAFGPLVLCPGNTAGELCETARLEWLDAVVVDTLDSTPRQVGLLEGVTGQVRSWMYDLGISSQLTQESPVPLPAANDLGDASFVLEARTTVAGQEVPVRAVVVVQQTEDTELGVPVVRKSASEFFDRDVQEDEAGLWVTFDPSPWIARLDLRPLLDPGSCAPDGPAAVCDGPLNQECAEDGTVVDAVDCSVDGQVCVQGRGCVDALILDSSTAGYDALRLALLAGERPVFSWSPAP